MLQAGPPVEPVLSAHHGEEVLELFLRGAELLVAIIVPAVDPVRVDTPVVTREYLGC